MTSPKGDGKPAADETDGVAAQENASQRTQPSRQANKQQVRHRASVACASCRDRRIRCVVPKGESECVQCKKAGNECVIKNDDERRRPISKAYMSSLSDRIAMLEGMLLEKGVEPPPPAHPPKTRREAQSRPPENEEKPIDTRRNCREPPGHSPLAEVPSPPESGSEEHAMKDTGRTGSAPVHGNVPAGQNFQPLPKEQSPFRMLDPKQEDLVCRLLSTKGNLSFDQLSGRQRFFGPTANSHVYADSSDQFDSREPSEQVRRAERMIRSLTIATHDYLMDSFWTHYNSVLKIIHRDAFDADRESQNPKFYSSFLHICILAMAFRFADADRDDMKRIALGSRESTLHREAKYMLDIELERPGGIPSVQALLILGDLECGVGRDNTGWMYAGMANRLAFDIGLHLDCSDNGIGALEVDIRHMVMRACVIYDKYWALFLGRPTSIKNQDIGMELLSRRFSQLTCLMGGTEAAIKKNGTAEIYEQLIELMELAGRIVESRDNNSHARNKYRGDGAENVLSPGDGEDNAYLHAINLDRQLQNWYRRLPEHLQWKPSAIKSAPFSYFLLHQQYHVSMILLHRPWAKYGTIAGIGKSTGSHPSPASASEPKDALDQHDFSMSNPSPGLNDPLSMVDDSRTSLSRSICTQQAIRVARIFWQHRQRFDGTKIFVTGIQHAGTAAIALIAALAYNHSDSDRRTYLGYLEILSSAVSDMSHTYQPAARMDDLLKAVLVQLRADIHDSGDVHQLCTTLTGSDKFLLSSSGWRGSMDNIYSILPARREADVGSSQSHKRRRPSATSRRASEFTRPPPPFFLSQTQPTPPRSSQSHRSVGHHPPIDPAMYATGSNDIQSFNLDFLNGSAIDHDLDDASEGMMRPSEEFVLAAPQPDRWALGELNPDDTMQSGSIGYEGLGLSDWSSRTAGPSTGSALGGSKSNASAARNDVPGENGATGGKSSVPRGLLSEQRNKGLSGEKGDTTDKLRALNAVDAGDMDWMGSEGGLSALSPVSLSGLVPSAMPEKGDDEPAGAQRNHELDFFSF